AARIEAVAVVHRLIRIGEVFLLTGVAGVAEAGAVAFAGKVLVRDHAAEHRARDAPEQAAGQDPTHPHAARLAEHALHGAGLADFRARRQAGQRLRIVADPLG